MHEAGGWHSGVWASGAQDQRLGPAHSGDPFQPQRAFPAGSRRHPVSTLQPRTRGRLPGELRVDSHPRRRVARLAQEREVPESPSWVPALPQLCPPRTSPVPAWASGRVTSVASPPPGTPPARLTGDWRLRAPPRTTRGPRWLRTSRHPAPLGEDPGENEGARPRVRRPAGVSAALCHVFLEELWCVSSSPECAPPPRPGRERDPASGPLTNAPSLAPRPLHTRRE